MSRRWFFGHALLLLLTAALLLVVFENSDLDRWLAQPFYDPDLHDFPLRQQVQIGPILYYVFKFAALSGAVVAAAGCLFGLAGRLDWLPPRNAALALLGLILIPSAVAWLKLSTNRHCPWDIVDFGGFAPYLGLLAEMPGEIVRGVCFPASHAATGFMWLAPALALHAASPRWSRRGIWLALGVGLLMGLTRQAQGGHFLSHTLWSAWLAWAMTVLLAALLGVSRSSLLAARPEHAGPDHGGICQT